MTDYSSTPPLELGMPTNISASLGLERTLEMSISRGSVERVADSETLRRAVELLAQPLPVFADIRGHRDDVIHVRFDLDTPNRFGDTVVVLAYDPELAQLERHNMAAVLPEAVNRALKSLFWM